ncbi:MAG: hypothetical protein J7K33_10220 [Candidatus Marinimicrobia bacterium]|nr:hypothetical protein [Candidatus Neomarinimicrobiota bacterium]
MSKAITYEYMETPEVVSNLGCLLHGIIISTDTNADTVIVYDGENETHDKVMQCKLAADRTVPIIFATPVKLKKGLYVKFSQATTRVTVLWSQNDF